jgi:hypothetical protein
VCPLQLPPVEIKKDAGGDVLNSVLPPRKWEDDGSTWVQYVSAVPSSRLDVIALQEQLDLKLTQRQSRETGICPVRRELYTEAFDELIRHVTINCAERGLLLLRVRDEIKMTIAAYQTLYESSVSFGMRKALQAEQGKMDLEKRIVEVEEEKKGLEGQVAALKVRCAFSHRTPLEDVIGFHAFSLQASMRVTMPTRFTGISLYACMSVCLYVCMSVKLVDKPHNQLYSSRVITPLLPVGTINLVQTLKAKCDEIEKRGAEQREVEKRKHEEAFQFQKRTNEQLKNQLESMLAPTKK